MKFKAFDIVVETEPLKKGNTISSMAGKIYMNPGQDILSHYIDNFSYKNYSFNNGAYAYFFKDCVITDRIIDEEEMNNALYYMFINYNCLRDLANSNINLLKLRESIQLEKNNIESNIRNYKSSLIREFANIQTINLRFNYMISKEDLLLRYNLDDNGCVYFEFKNVIAEDTECIGEDIDLGNLKFRVSIFHTKAIIVEGTYKRSTQYSNSAHHPHDLGGEICLGTQSSDFIQAVQSLDLQVVEAILSKFAHSYNSLDSAGTYWKKWANKKMEDDEDMVWSEYHERDIPRANAIFVESREDYFEADSIVYDNNGHAIYEGDAIMLENGFGWINGDDDEDYVTIKDNYYHVNDSNIVIDIDDEYQLKSNCEYSESLNKYIVISDAIYHNEDWYTEDTLPNEETNQTSDTILNINQIQEEQQVVITETQGMPW